MLKRSIFSYATAALLTTAASIQAQSTTTMVHFEGCVFPEAALTSATPVVVPSGSTQPYLLTNVKVVSGSVTDEQASKTIYTLVKADREELRVLYGKRVGVTGRLEGGGARPNLEVVGIREISGGCPTLPTVPTAP